MIMRPKVPHLTVSVPIDDLRKLRYDRIPSNIASETIITSLNRERVIKWLQSWTSKYESV